LSRPVAAEKNSENRIMRAVVQMIHEGFVWLGFTILVLLMVVLLPAAALLTRALIPVTAATITVLFVASCFSSRMRNWLYS
jgi:ABC-type methionine transport system permease subunit